MALAESLRSEAIRPLLERTRPVTLAGERTLPVLPALEPLLPDGLRRGATVTVDGGPGATALAMALAAEASAAGSWVAVVGDPSFGLLAAAELGLAPERLLVVPDPPPEQWATVVAALLDGVDVVLAGARRRIAAGDARRLTARARERGVALVALPWAGRTPWPEAPDVRLTVCAATWSVPHGRLAARRVEVEAGGRGAAARPRRAALWLPGPDGAVAPAGPHR